MRFYDVQIGDTASGLHYTSHPRGPAFPPDPGALNIEMDIQAVGKMPTYEAYLRIWGVGIDIIGQARNLNAPPGGAGLPITVKGGMGKGLPLANPSQAGVLVKGTIFQAYGNWVGVNQTLDIKMIPGTDRMPSQLQ